MYLASYVVLEIVMQLTQHQLLGAPKAASNIELQTKVSPADFELEAPTGGEDDDEGDEAPLIKNTKDTTDGTPAIRAGASDLEAAKDGEGQNNDPFTSPRFLRLKIIFDCVDAALLRIGSILHVVFIYWAFLDFIHPHLGNTIRSISNSNWGGLLLFLFSIPIMVLNMFMVMALSFFLAVVPYILVCYLRECLVFIGRFLPASFHTFVQEWVQKAKTAFFSINDRCLCLFALGFNWVTAAAFLALLSFPDSVWVYGLISAELVILLVFGLISFGLRVSLKRVVAKVYLSNERFEASLYLDKVGATLLTGVIISFVVLTLWYEFRYPYFEVGKCRDSWREYLYV